MDLSDTRNWWFWNISRKILNIFIFLKNKRKFLFFQFSSFCLHSKPSIDCNHAPSISCIQISSQFENINGNFSFISFSVYFSFSCMKISRILRNDSRKIAIANRIFVWEFFVYDLAPKLCSTHELRWREGKFNPHIKKQQCMCTCLREVVYEIRWINISKTIPPTLS
jgi:hypothetical protein